MFRKIGFLLMFIALIVIPLILFFLFIWIGIRIVLLNLKQVSIKIVSRENKSYFTARSTSH